MKTKQKIVMIHFVLQNFVFVLLLHHFHMDADLFQICVCIQKIVDIVVIL